MTTSVWFENGAIQVQGVGVFPAQSLTTAVDAVGRVHVSTLSARKIMQLTYDQYADKAGNTFASATAAKAYLDGEFAKQITGQPGANGATWTVGSGTPTAAAAPNDLYLDLNNGDVYRNN